MPEITHVMNPNHPPEPMETLPQKTVPPAAKFTYIKTDSLITAPSGPFIDKIKQVVEKVKHVALIILNVGFSALLYWVNPSLFAIGFIAGIIIDDHVRSAIQKIKDVWVNQKITGMIFSGFACALSMPVSLAAASLLWSARLGSIITADAQDKFMEVGNPNERPSLGEKTQTLVVTLSG